MPFLQQIICPNCGKTYSPLRATCPHCGEKNQTRSMRTPSSTDSVRRGTQDHTRAEKFKRWQVVFGICIAAAIVVSLVVLVLTVNNGNYDLANAPATPTPSVTVTPTLTPKPTSTPTPTPVVEFVTITFLGEEKTGFTMNPYDHIDLDATVYPTEITEPVTWSSTNEEVCTVDEMGMVSGVASGNASVIAECFGKTAECQVIVK